MLEHLPYPESQNKHCDLTNLKNATMFGSSIFKFKVKFVVRYQYCMTRTHDARLPRLMLLGKSRSFRIRTTN